MKEKILESLLKRPGLEGKESILADMIEDSISDMRTLLNYGDDEELPKGCVPAVKELTLIRFNQDGVEGISSEAQSSGGSTTYLGSLPKTVRQAVRRYRRFRR